MALSSPARTRITVAAFFGREGLVTWPQQSGTLRSHFGMVELKCGNSGIVSRYGSKRSWKKRPCRNHRRGHRSHYGNFWTLWATHESKNFHSAICVHSGDYGTISSSMIFYSRNEKRFHYFHTSTPPCRSDYEEFPTVEAK